MDMAYQVVKVVPSPNRKKKFRAILQDGVTVDFGAHGYSDYTKHKSASRMRAYVLRHGGHVPRKIRRVSNERVLQLLMLSIGTSDTEDWHISGIKKAGFWSRWYLWSFPTIRAAKQHMLQKFGVEIK